MWHKISFDLIPSVLKSEKNWAIKEITKKTSLPPLFADIFHFTTIFGGTDFFFLKFCQLIIFSRILKRMAPNYLEEQSPNIQLPKWFGIHHIRRRGGASQLTYQHFLGVSWKFWVPGLLPLNVVDTKLFWYLDIRGSLFRTIWCHPFQNPRKNLSIDRISKKRSEPPKIVVKLENICK